MRKCELCGKKALISKALKVCVDCLRDRPDEARPFAEEAHRKSREKFGLPFNR